MKKYLIEFLKDIGIEPNFIAMSISILLIIAITSIVIHLVLHKIILKAIKKIYKLSIESIDIKAMKGEKGTYRIRKGTLRIIFRIDANGTLIVASVNEIDFRGSVYK